MRIRNVSASAAVLLLLAGCAAGASDQAMNDLRKQVEEAKDASLAAQRAAEAAQQAAGRSAEAAQAAAKSASDAGARAEAIYNRSLRKGGSAAKRMN